MVESRQQKIPDAGTLTVSRVLQVGINEVNGGIELAIHIFPPFFGRYRQTFRRLEGATMYCYTVLSAYPIKASLIQPIITRLHAGQISIVAWEGRWWESAPKVFTGNEIWREVDRRSQQYKIQ